MAVSFTVKKTMPFPQADVAKVAMDYSLMNDVYGPMAASKYEIIKEGKGVPYGKGCIAKLTLADGGMLTEECTDADPPRYFKKELKELIKPSRIAPMSYTLEVRVTPEGASTTLEFAISAQLNKGCWSMVQASFFKGAQREALNRIASYLQRKGGPAGPTGIRKCLASTPFVNQCINRQLDTLTSDDVFVLMHHLELVNHAKAFRKAAVTGRTLSANITEDDLQQIGMTLSLHRKALLQWVELFKAHGVPGKMLASLGGAKSSSGEEGAPDTFAVVTEHLHECLDGTKDRVMGCVGAVSALCAKSDKSGGGPKAGGRRQQVIAQKVEVPKDWKAPVHPKSTEEAAFLKDVCMTDALFKSLNKSDLEIIMRAFQQVKFEVGTQVIKQGDAGDKLFIIQSGECDISVNGKTVMKAKRGVKFGELALLHNAPRAATVTATSPVETFSLDGTTFKAIMMGKAQQDTKDYLGFIQEVRILQSLPKADQMRLIDALQEREYEEGVEIIKEGEEGDYFYIIRQGEVKCTQASTGEFEVSRRLRNGDYFGELSLLSSQRRAATVVATRKTQVLSLERAAFVRLLGPLSKYLQESADETYGKKAK